MPLAGASTSSIVWSSAHATFGTMPGVAKGAGCLLTAAALTLAGGVNSTSSAPVSCTPPPPPPVGSPTNVSASVGDVLRGWNDERQSKRFKSVPCALALAAAPGDAVPKWATPAVGFAVEPGGSTEPTAAEADRASVGGHTWLKRSEVSSHLRATSSNVVQRFERACLAKAVRETHGSAAGVPGVLGAVDTAALQELDAVVADVQDRANRWQPKGGKYLRISKNGLGHARAKQAKSAGAAEGALSTPTPTPAPTTATATSDDGAAQGPGQASRQLQGSSRGLGTSPAGFHDLTDADVSAGMQERTAEAAAVASRQTGKKARKKSAARRKQGEVTGTDGEEWHPTATTTSLVEQTSLRRRVRACVCACVRVCVWDRGRDSVLTMRWRV